MVQELFQVLQRHLSNRQRCDICGHDGSLAFSTVTELCAIQDDAPIIVVGILLGEYAKEVAGEIRYQNLCADCIRERIDKVRPGGLTSRPARDRIY